MRHFSLGSPDLSPVHSVVPTRDGAKIACEIRGHGEPTVLLSNGIGCHQVFLQRLIDRLAPTRRVVSWHYRGHGDSPPMDDPGAWSLDMNVDDMAAVLDHVGATRAVLGGFSMGVQLNLEFYRRFPHRVSGIVNLCGAHESPLRTFLRMGPVADPAFAGLHAIVRKLPGFAQGFWSVLLGGPWAYRAAGVVIYSAERMSREDFAQYQRHFIDIDLNQFLACLRDLNRHSARDVLPNVRVPVLVVAGDKDNFTPLTVSETMHREIPNAELLVVPGGTHAALIEFPELINERVARFLECHFGLPETDAAP
ncbi:MAG: alpha/beta hydrolase [Deltaproteobacteria bacterium]|nr:alpha/beta hydrolase [Deltaproteobacteria bacterium]